MKNILLLFLLLSIFSACEKKKSTLVNSQLSTDAIKEARTLVDIKFPNDSISIRQNGPHIVSKEASNHYLLDESISKQQNSLDKYVAYLTFYKDTTMPNNRSYEYAVLLGRYKDTLGKYNFKTLEAIKLGLK